MFVLESMKRYYRYLAFALPAVLYVGTIWQRPLFFPVEINAAELLRRTAVAGGNGVALLGSWSVKLFGANLFAVRLPDALAVLLTALLIRAVASGCGNRKTGDAAALIYLTTFFVFAFGTAAGTGASFTLFCSGVAAGLIRALSDGKLPVRIAGGAGAAVSAALAVWYGMSGGAAPGFVLWKTLLFLLAGMLPWLFFAPAALKGFRLGGAAYRKQPLFLIPAAAVGVWLAAVILWNGRLPDGALTAGFPMLAILTAGGLVRYGEAGDLVYVNTVLRSLVRIFLPLPLLLFLLQAAARFTGKVPPEFVVYGRNENYFMPVLALVVTLVWLRMAEREYRQQLKFVFFCVGVAFLLLAAPGSLPQRMLRGVAPEPFLGMVLESRLDAEPVIVARPGVHAAVAWTLKRDDVRLWTEDGEVGNLLNGQPRTLVVVTDDRRDLAKLSDPKTYFRSGGWYVVCYDSLKEKR